MEISQELFELVRNEISKQTSTKGERSGQISYALTSGESTDMSEALQNIFSSVANVVGRSIISGLDISATEPPSLIIDITAGRATTGAGLIEEITADTTINCGIITSGIGGIWYITLYQSIFYVVQNKPDTHAIIGKIIAHKKSLSIADDRPEDGYDAYLVSAKDFFFDGTKTIDDDGMREIARRLPEIAASVLFGTLKASEQLTITNTRGTVELGSKSMKFKNVDGDVIAEYGSEKAWLGNMELLTDRFQSRNFRRGVRGFRILDTGDVEFGNAVIRGALHSSVFTKDMVSAMGGHFVIASATVLDEAIPADAAYDTFNIKEGVLSDGTLVRCKDGFNDEWMKVMSGGGTTRITVTRDFGSTGLGTWEKGTAIASMMDRIHLVGDGQSNSPYMDVIDRDDTDDILNESVKVRVGNLAGIVDPDFGTLEGYGIFTSKGYFKGDIVASTVSTSLQDPRIVMNSEALRGYNQSGNAVWEFFNVPDGSGNVAYIGSTYPLTVDQNGIVNMNADAINAGSIRGINITAGAHLTKGSYLTDALSGGENVISVKDAADFPSSGDGWIIDTTNDRDSFTYSGKSGNILTQCTGVLAHNDGAIIIPRDKCTIIDVNTNEMRFYGLERDGGDINELISMGIKDIGGDIIIGYFGSPTSRRIGIYAEGNSVGVIRGIHYSAYGNTGNGVTGQAYGPGSYGTFGESFDDNSIGVLGKGRGTTSHGVRGNGPADGWDFYASGVGSNYGPFTGAHDGLVLKKTEICPGDIIIDKYILHKHNLSNTIAVCELSHMPMQVESIGVMVWKARVSVKNPPAALLNHKELKGLSDKYELISFNALGEGQINVCREGGDIKQGDYICSSNTPGKGAKQNDNIYRNYTVAKARESANWDREDNSTRQIACIYLCG